MSLAVTRPWHYSRWNNTSMDHIRVKDAAATSFSRRVVGEREAEEMDCGMIWDIEIRKALDYLLNVMKICCCRWQILVHNGGAWNGTIEGGDRQTARRGISTRGEAYQRLIRLN